MRNYEHCTGGGLMLRGTKLSKRFGAVAACSDVSIAIERGKILGVIGPNGAGKSTLINMLGGQWAPNSGTIQAGGETITKWSVHKRARRAHISRTFQTPRIFPTLSVRENIAIGQRLSVFGGSDGGSGVAETTGGENALLDRFDLRESADRPAGDLAHGARRWVELGRCLNSKPSYLLFDEPTAGLSPAEVEKFRQIILSLRAENMGLLLVVHDVDLIMNVSDFIVVLNFGKVLAAGPPELIAKDDAVRQAYLGAA
jgi:branched-chain amino acid transport system ATP-binding protein